MDTAYEPDEWGNNLKIALIQKREEFSDSTLPLCRLSKEKYTLYYIPRMYDTEMSQHDNSHPEVVTKLKVIKYTQCM